MSKRTCTTAAMICGLAAMAVLAGCGGDSPAPVAPTPEATIKQLTATDAVYEANPIYAPDGSAILFESDATGNREIWLLPTNGAAALQLTDNAGEDTAPFWLPDGSGFVFESTRSGTKSIWRLDLAPAGSAPVQITDDAGDDGSPAVSPDGTLVVYESNRGGNGQDLWLSPVGGGTAVRLTVSVGGSYDRTADWSPDGNTIVFESNRKDGMSALFTVPAKGGAFTQLTPLAGYEGHPAWSPDGRRVAFESGQSGTMEVWCIDVDGKNPRQLTSDGGYWPRWSPNGRKLVYCNWGALAPNLWEITIQ
ncbi:MAG: PD40 domain-containing protein [bacterium]|nr:PD40 domain-containing protein [bacterium]